MVFPGYGSGPSASPPSSCLHTWPLSRVKIDRPRAVLASSTTVAVILVIFGGGGGFPKSSTLVTAWGGENPNLSRSGASLAGCAGGAPLVRSAAASKHFN